MCKTKAEPHSRTKKNTEKHTPASKPRQAETCPRPTRCVPAAPGRGVSVRAAAAWLQSDGAAPPRTRCARRHQFCFFFLWFQMKCLKNAIKSSWKFPQGRKGRVRRDGLRGRQGDPALLPGEPRPAAAAEGPPGPQFQPRDPEAPPGSPRPERAGRRGAYGRAPPRPTRAFAEFRRGPRCVHEGNSRCGREQAKHSGGRGRTNVLEKPPAT